MNGIDESAKLHNIHYDKRLECPDKRRNFYEITIFHYIHFLKHLLYEPIHN